MDMSICTYVFYLIQTRHCADRPFCNSFLETLVVTVSCIQSLQTSILSSYVFVCLRMSIPAHHVVGHSAVSIHIVRSKTNLDLTHRLRLLNLLSYLAPHHHVFPSSCWCLGAAVWYQQGWELLCPYSCSCRWKIVDKKDTSCAKDSTSCLMEVSIAVTREMSFRVARGRERDNRICVQQW